MQDSTTSTETVNPFGENDTISQIFDKLLKRILSLSKGAVIDFINGMFDENFPPDSEATFNSTEKAYDYILRAYPQHTR